MYQSRSEVLSTLSTWALAGRLAVSDEEDGGSGNLRWQQSDEISLMKFHGALGRGAWRIEANHEGAELELADGTVYKSRTVGELVKNQLGWEIPVEKLAWWVRGLCAPGDLETRVLDDQGRLSSLSQGGWSIEYGRYRDFDGVELPVRVSASRRDWKVKLAIRDWTLSAEYLPDEH